MRIQFNPMRIDRITLHCAIETIAFKWPHPPYYHVTTCTLMELAQAAGLLAFAKLFRLRQMHAVRRWLRATEIERSARKTKGKPRIVAVIIIMSKLNYIFVGYVF